MNRLPVGVVLLSALVAGAAHAGHELSFYPSYYPQEIRIETLAPAAAAAGLEDKSLHAYVGVDPYGGGPAPTHVQFVESLAGYLVLTFDTARPAAATAAARCAAARSVLAALAPARGFVFHPYPVTPHHPDYLQHADLVATARTGVATGVPAPAALGVRAGGPLAARALAGRWPEATATPDATLEVVDLESLTGVRPAGADAWPERPWLKAGWYLAYRMTADRLADPAARAAADGLVRRLTRGEYASTVERLNRERELVMRLGAGCERVVVGYVVRREPFNAEFSAGIENVASDGHTGLDAPIFVRTAKLKDFPWNGWLRVGVPARATAAWNPVAGFTDPTGRLVWAALGDPAFFPAPRSASWIGNRVTVGSIAAASEVPRDALVPEPGTGMLREVGRAGVPAAVKVVYRVLASPFHDGSRMTPADALAGLAFAYRWGRPGGDPAVEAATARLRDWLAGLRVARVDTSEREFGEVKFVTTTMTIEVWGRYRLEDDLQTAAIAPPWSTVPWTVLWLSERAVTGSAAAFSAGEAERRGVPWLDLARDAKLVSSLATLVDQYVAGAPVPPEIAGRVSREEAVERWRALRDFYRARHHLLVTNGPYRLESWSDDAVVLAVFRDLNYPLGVGSYDRYAIPLRAYPARLERRGDRVEVHADVDVVEKFQREYRIVRQPLRTAAVDQADLPVCRYLVVGADGRVVAAGVAPYAGRGAFAVDVGGLRGGPRTVLVALVVRDNALVVEAGVLTLGER